MLPDKNKPSFDKAPGSGDSDSWFKRKELKDTHQIAEIVTPPETKPRIDVIYQSLQGLHTACPNHLGDWYFSGNYPTPGGMRVVNRAFVNYMEGRDARAYD